MFEPVEKDLYLDFTGHGANYLIFRVAETTPLMKRFEQYSGSAYEVSYWCTNFHDRISWSLTAIRLVARFRARRTVMELIENGFLFNSLGQVTNRLVFMVAEALPFKTCEKCFAGAYDVSDFFGNSH